jgi:acetylornithine deacetylase
MTIDPFAATIHGGRLHGRGACDVKGGMAAMLAAFARLVRDRPAGAANVVMACTVDEEHTFLGIQRLAPGIQVDRAVVAEPTSLRIVHTHKGAARWHLETQGRACHSSSPEQGINAIYRMGRLVAALEDYAARLPATKSDPYLGPPTLSVGRIEGGTSVNTVPDRCRIEIDRRLIPGEDAASALVDLTAFLRSAVGVDVAFSCSDPWICLPPLPSQGGPAKQQLIADLGRLLDETLGRHEIIAVPYGTDASTLAAAGIPTVVFGPGDIAQAHTRDEWVSLEEVETASDLLYRLALLG